MSPGSHLDDDRLSAFIDGAAAEADVEHATSCPECRARVAAWADARRLVATVPPAPPAAQRDSAVAAALAAADEPAAPAEPADLADLGTGETPAAPVASLSERRLRRARRARAGLAVAAGVAVLGLVAGVVHAGGSHSSSNSASRSAVAGAGSSGAPSSPAPNAAAAPPGVQTVAHLGAVEGPGPLVGMMRSALGANPAAITPSTGSTAGGSSAAGSTAPGSPSSGSATPAAGSSTPAAGPASPDTAVTACLGPATADAHLPAGSTPRLEASLTYQGVPAAAFVFDQASQHEVVVVATLGCGLLADVSF